jgi:hypothetical protein
MFLFWVGALLGAIWASGSTPDHLRVRRAVVDGRGYRVVSHGPGMLEVFSELQPSTFVLMALEAERAKDRVFNVVASGGRLEDVELLREDLLRFPRKLFASVEAPATVPGVPPALA